MPSAKSKTSERVMFTGIPMDYCPRCEKRSREVFEQSERPPVPLAVSGLGTNHCFVRYACPNCRLIWDCFRNMEADDMNQGPFEDEFILWHEGLESHPTGEVPFPAGPKNLLASRKPS